MNRLIAGGAAFAFLVALVTAASAHPAQHGFDASPVFTNDYGDHYVHDNDSPRFNFDDGNAPRGIAVNGAQADPDEHAAVQPHSNPAGDGILINPAG